MAENLQNTVHNKIRKITVLSDSSFYLRGFTHSLAQFGRLSGVHNHSNGRPFVGINQTPEFLTQGFFIAWLSNPIIDGASFGLLAGQQNRFAPVKQRGGYSMFLALEHGAEHRLDIVQ